MTEGTHFANIHPTPRPEAERVGTIIKPPEGSIVTTALPVVDRENLQQTRGVRLPPYYYGQMRHKEAGFGKGDFITGLGATAAIAAVPFTMGLSVILAPIFIGYRMATRDTDLKNRQFSHYVPEELERMQEFVAKASVNPDRTEKFKGAGEILNDFVLACRAGGPDGIRKAFDVFYEHYLKHHPGEDIDMNQFRTIAIGASGSADPTAQAQKRTHTPEDFAPGPRLPPRLSETQIRAMNKSYQDYLGLLDNNNKQCLTMSSEKFEQFQKQNPTNLTQPQMTNIIKTRDLQEVLKTQVSALEQDNNTKLQKLTKISDTAKQREAIQNLIKRLNLELSIIKSFPQEIQAQFKERHDEANKRLNELRESAKKEEVNATATQAAAAAAAETETAETASETKTAETAQTAQTASDTH